MGINSENNSNIENLKQQENLASAVDGVTSSAQQLASANTKVADSTRDMRDGIDSTTDKLDKMQEGLDKTLRSIHLLPAAIEEYTKTINKNMAYAREDLQEGFFKGILNEKLWGFRAELGRETEELKQAMEASKKSALQAIEHANKTGKEQDKQIADAAKLRAQQLETAYQNRKNMKFSQQLNIKLARDMKTQLLEIGKKMFSDLWGYAKKLLDDAYSKDKSTIEQNYDTIMSMNSYNHGEYAKLIDRLQEKIDASGLGDVISVNTLQENLTKTMQMGLQGALAESNAYYASIAEKAGITFDWYGTEWTNLISQMNRTGKDYEKVMKSVITTTDDLAEVYGDSTGLAGGRANQMMSAASTLGTTYGLSEEAIGNIYKSLAVTSQELTNYGIDTTNFVQDITGALESGLSNKDLGVIFGTGGASGAEVEAKIKAGRFDELMLQYMDNLEAMYKGQNSEMVNALQGALGSSFSNTDYQAFQTYWEQEGSLSDNFNKVMSASNSSMEDINGELKNYVTTQESYETKMENNLAKIAEFYTQNPILEVIGKTLQGGLATIIGILTAWGGKQLLNKFLGGKAGNPGGLFNFGKSLRNSKLPDGFKLGKNGQLLELQASKGGSGPLRWMKSSKSVSDVTGGATKVGGLSKIGQFFNNGTAFASKGGTLAKVGSKVFSTGGKALGITGSLISMGIDGYQGYKEDGWAGAIRGAITGSGKAATSGWDVAKGAGSGALKGAGIGMMFGPLGAGIGAAVGGLAGLVTGIIDVTDKQKQLKIGLEGLNTAAANFTETLSKSEERQTKSLSLEKLAEKAKKGDIAATKQLASIIPDVNNYLDENGTLQAEYGDTLDQLIKLEQQKLYRETLYDYGTQYNENEALHAGTLKTNTETHLGNLTKAQTIKSWDSNLDTMTKNAENAHLTSGYSMSKMGFISYTDADGKTVEAPSVGKEKTEWEINTLKSLGAPQEIIDAVSNGSVSGTEALAKLGLFGDGSTNDTVKGYINGFDNWYNKYKDTYAEIQKAVSSLQKVIFTPEQIKSYMGFSSWSSLTSAWPSNAEFTAQDTFNRGFQAFNSLYDYASSKDSTVTAYLYNLLTDEQKSKYKSYFEYLTATYKDASPLALYEKFNSIAGFEEEYKPKFAVGTVGNSTIPYDNYLALLHRGEQIKTSAEVALDEAKHVASTNTQSTIHDVVLNQTNTIINLLTNIYQVLSSGRANPVKLSTKIKYDLPGAT